jgi:hypothetical protein
VIFDLPGKYRYTKPMISYVYALIALLGVLVAHILGVHGLYTYIYPYDVFMHLFGGFGIGLFVYALASSFGPSRAIRWFIVASVIMAGIAWEIFEVQYGVTGHPFGSTLYYIDTAKDLVNDTIGGIIAALICVRKRLM